MAIEKLERFNDYEDSGDGRWQTPEKDGVYVLYAAAREREDELLTALTCLFYSHCLNAGHSTQQTCPICLNAYITRNEIERTQ